MAEKRNKNDDLTINDNYWYSAQTKLGVLYIGIDRNLFNANIEIKDLPALLQKAIVLKKVETLLQHVEDWLKCGLVLSPATIMPNSIYTIIIHNKRSIQDTELNSIILGIQHTQLEMLSDPSTTILDNISIKTSCVSVQIILSEFTIEKEQYELIEDGRILLIPDSYNGVWHIKLKYLKQPYICLDGIINRDIRTLVITEHSFDENPHNQHQAQHNSQESSNRRLKIILSEEIPISLDCLLGWADNNTVLLDRSLRHYKADLTCDSQLIASGHLISVADGYGLNINSCKAYS
jgi:hypothetical protein